VKPAWTAGVTRARLLLGHVAGAEHALDVAGCGSLHEGLGVLAGSAYGERVDVGMELASAERGIAETLLWHLRILAGWLPRAGAGLVRALAAWFELANVDARLAALMSDGHEPSPFVLGGLATSWRTIEAARTVEEVADAVAASVWGDPGRRSAAGIALGLRVAWARRVQEAEPGAARWVEGAAALLVARELLLAGARRSTAQLERLPGIGEKVLKAGSLEELQAVLPAEAGWALAGVHDPSELWRAELAWWLAVEREAPALLRNRHEETVVLAAVALLAVDAHRIVRALRAAAQGGAPELMEPLDAAP